MRNDFEPAILHTVAGRVKIALNTSNKVINVCLQCCYSIGEFLSNFFTMGRLELIISWREIFNFGWLCNASSQVNLSFKIRMWKGNTIFPPGRLGNCCATPKTKTKLVSWAFYRSVHSWVLNRMTALDDKLHAQPTICRRTGSYFWTQPSAQSGHRLNLPGTRVTAITAQGQIQDFSYKGMHQWGMAYLNGELNIKRESKDFILVGGRGLNLL